MAEYHWEPRIRTIWDYEVVMTKPPGKLRNAVGWFWLAAGLVSLAMWVFIFHTVMMVLG